MKYWIGDQGMLTRLAKVIVLSAALAGLISFYANEIWRSSKGPHASQIQIHQEHPQYEAKHDNIFADGWNWTTQDPVSFYTFLLAIFTAALVSVSAVQIRFLIRADRTARISAIAARRAANATKMSATAAKVAADSVVAIERARLYAIINDNFVNCVNAANAWDDIGQEEIPLGMDNWPMAGITFKNYGKTPGIIEEVATGVEYSEIIPDPVHNVKVVNKNIIGPGDESEQFGTLITGQITMAQAIKVRDGAANIWVYGYASYIDVFGNRQIHRFFQRLVRVQQFRYVLQSYDYKHYNQSS